MSEPLELKRYIRSIPDFPKPGILFRDITPLLATPHVFRHVIDQFAEHYRGHRVNAVVAAEARGFIFAAPLAIALEARFIPVRKPGKLPFDTHSFHYELEYGKDSLEMHIDALLEGDRVLLVDDLLATGGTMAACIGMAKRAGAEVVGTAFLIELDFLTGAAGSRRSRSFRSSTTRMRPKPWRCFWALRSVAPNSSSASEPVTVPPLPLSGGLTSIRRAAPPASGNKSSKSAAIC